jgi:hypothetical protein
MVIRQEIERYNQRLDRSGWSLAAILTGSVLLRQSPVGVWLIGAAVILLGMNLIRLILHVPMSTLTLVLGATMLVMGLGFAVGVNLFLIPLLLIVGGFVALFKTLNRSRIVD